MLTSCRSERWSRLPWIRRFWGGLGLLVLAALGACAPPPPPPLVLGLGPWVGYDPFIVAREERLVDASRVKIVELSTTAESVRHLRNGLLDAAAITLDQALALTEQGVDLRVVAVLDLSAGADVVMAAPHLSRPAQLRGQVVLLEPSTVSALMLHGVLAAGGLQASDVHVVTLEASQHLAALRDGRAVAAVSYEPLATQLRQAGYVDLFDSHDMPGQILDVLVVRAEHLSLRAGDVDEMLRAWEDGLARFQADGKEAAAWLAPSIGMSADTYMNILSGLHFTDGAESLGYLSGVNAPVRQQGQALADALLSMGQLRQLPDWGRLIDDGPAQRTVHQVVQP